MAVVNRDLNPSEQMIDLSAVVTTTVAASAGQTFQAIQVPWPCILQRVALAPNTISGAPTVAIDIKRFTAAGLTQIAYVSTTLAVTAFGLSAAYQSISLAGPGTTLAQLQAGDVICVNQLFSGGNVAAGNMVVTAVLQATQDIKQHFGYSGN